SDVDKGQDVAGPRINQVEGHLHLASFLGSYTECEVRAGGHTLSVKVQMSDKSAQREPGTQVFCQWNPEDVLVMPAE
ncbi:TOBE domain-containing protein, partial [Acinetobacter baumannii]|uniref:TOBE domain-containing protein n=1 Tax=Acinetobacter baumannii TaxID=470 RepID=UPI000E095CB2